jgi:hypothetical protein
LEKGDLKMLEKIEDCSPICSHPSHLPPTLILLEPGRYKHTCPACGFITIFVVPCIGMSKYADKEVN